MVSPPPNIGAIIKNTRQNMGLTLEQVSKKTGVSKAMLGQVERGDSNPTVSTLWKISSGLQITFSKLLSEESENYYIKKLEDIQVIYEDDKKMLLYNIFPFNPVTGFDYFYIELKPGCRYLSPSHSNVFEEYIVVTKGCLTLEINEKKFILNEGNSISFKGDAKHLYANESNKITIFQNIMKYL